MDRPSETKVANSATIKQVVITVGELMGKDRSLLNAATSLGSIGCDELDFVEIVMELEEHFNITISDASLNAIMGTDDWKKGIERITLADLASLIDALLREAKRAKP